MSAVLRLSLSLSLPTSSSMLNAWPWLAERNSWILASRSAIGCSKSRKFGFIYRNARRGRAKERIITQGGRFPGIATGGGKDAGSGGRCGLGQHQLARQHAGQGVDAALEVNACAHAPFGAEFELRLPLRILIAQAQRRLAADVSGEQSAQTCAESRVDAVELDAQQARLPLAYLAQGRHAACAQTEAAGKFVDHEAAFDHQHRIARQQRCELDESLAEQADLDASGPVLDLCESHGVAAFLQRGEHAGDHDRLAVEAAAALLRRGWAVDLRQLAERRVADLHHQFAPCLGWMARQVVPERFAFADQLLLQRPVVHNGKM